MGRAALWPGEVFPRWMIGLAGRRVPIELAEVPASMVAVLLMVAGMTIWAGYQQLAEASAGREQAPWSAVGPTVIPGLERGARRGHAGLLLPTAWPLQRVWARRGHRFVKPASLKVLCAG
jgi:hypothetical protein